MANIYFGANNIGTNPAINGNWNTITNWYSSPGGAGSCCCAGTYGTLANRFPTTADTVIVIDNLTTGYSGGVWSGPVVVSTGDSSNGNIAAGTYSGNVSTVAYSTISGGTFNGSIIFGSNGTLSGGTFNGSISTLADAYGTYTISGGTFNGSFTGTSPSTNVNSSLNIYGGNFNTAIPSNFNNYGINGGVFDRDLVLGTSTQMSGVVLNHPSLNRNVNINMSYFYFNTFANKNVGGYLTIDGGNYTGLISVTKSPYSTLVVNGGSYSPPAVVIPAIKSGNYMTFNSSAIPIDLGFRAAGGTFNPTINLSGTSNEILGAGLL